MEKRLLDINESKTNMVLTINKCPKCGDDEFEKTYYVKRLWTQHFRVETELNNLIINTGSSHSDWEDKYKQPDKIRCMNCKYSVERYVKYI